ncbi:UDP-forming cellulose synthase catalytic subunit [Pseudomonas sp. NW5]|uniref:UDP-forming cellulose synthase catalytic subunit n=1 Tax=Pseudomonas sp. NW5 TaxID=2934934 RepID=UPI002020716B|nr:UDP-forming cellulose synthase catalytic subunit [Pseudomonas sp. NW5]MCL7462381.1 UDP-forming cellulose synthase catalytic subunit [Pseudomonas sp. NW5]
MSLRLPGRFPWYYRTLRQQQGASVPVALLGAVLGLLAALLLRLEAPAWQALLARYRQRFAAEPELRAHHSVRHALQLLWLLLVREQGAPRRILLRRWTEEVAAESAERPLRRAMPWQRAERAIARLPQRVRQLLLVSLGSLTALLAWLCITTPFGVQAQLLFVGLLWALALLIRRQPGRFAVLLLILLSVVASCRYLWWRYTATLNWETPLDLTCGLILLAAETYAWLVLMLGYLQTSWPLGRKPAPLPADRAQWPTVDLLIPTYNEDLSVVRNTVYAALGLDWPADKLRIHLLDDGRRETFRAFAAEVGIDYLIRPDNRHAKAGNLNHALTQIDGELVAIFDCDHVPVRAFLQFTVGWFLRDPKLALVQTPHHFFSPDPFERNLGTFRRRPNEGELFYGLVQEGNDLWNAAFFCGSCAVLRRAAIDSIGGFAVETVTEDAHTALRLHRQGWNSAYLRIPLAAGLATESLSAHIGQRIRWARGMVQIFRTDNPFLGRGLSFFQRICYANAMLSFLAGLPRLIFLTAPLAFLLLHAYIIYAPPLMILIHVLPHMAHASLANSRMQGAFRHSFWGEVYETVLAWYITWPTTMALIDPGKGKFNVTAKGGLMEDDQFDWRIARPYLLLAALNVLGLGFAVWRLRYGPVEEAGTVLISLLWVFYNLLIIGGALAVAAEVRQVRQNHRVATDLPAALRLPDGHLLQARLVDYSSGGAGLALTEARSLATGSAVWLLLRRGNREFAFPAQVSRCTAQHLGLNFAELDLQQQIDLVQCTFARADAWLNWGEEHAAERPLRSLFEVLALGIQGYLRLMEHLPAPLRALYRGVQALFRGLGSLLPRPLPSTPSRAVTER